MENDYKNMKDIEIEAKLTALVEGLEGFKLIDGKSPILHKLVKKNDAQAWKFEEWHEITNYLSMTGSLFNLAIDKKLSLMRIKDGYTSFKGWDYVDLSIHDNFDDCCIDGVDFISGEDKCAKRATAICLIKVFESELNS